MQLNTNLMNVMRQLLESIQQSGERRYYDNSCPEVARLGKIAVDCIIEAQFPGEDVNDDTIRHVATSVILQHIQLYIKP